MSKRLRVSGHQMLVSRDVAQNEKRILEAVELAGDQESDFLLTPEGSLSEYYADFDGQEVASAVARVADRAGKAGVGLALGTCYKELELVGPDGTRSLVVPDSGERFFTCDITL